MKIITLHLLVIVGEGRDSDTRAGVGSESLSLRQFKRWSQGIKIHKFHQRPFFFNLGLRA